MNIFFDNLNSKIHTHLSTHILYKLIYTLYKWVALLYTYNSVASN